MFKTNVLVKEIPSIESFTEKAGEISFMNEEELHIL